ncbi:pyrroloquinoline quinone biosynthesis protein PqqB [Marinibacterium profundimaris]|uniref:Coenzyme PQQ synthesis protein B n=1 Tax=Marinibacterium profundimaris TaxID=1679460 RepID=A0A225P056_9RHOB|nr:pyrroloquinoline quinone biosynthesis protein PqqB [Marinibacterium profundimaris]OWU77666.1 pyrroloquinoline quinone biosynthesis protein PqqB [Marinibacterium profundimaris]
MHVTVLGAGAGGGLPQWNCGCANCSDARSGKIPPMTQSSVGVSLDGTDWVVLNASPDIRDQLARTPEFHPRALRDTPIHTVVLTNGDIDHVAGLLTLREKTAFRVAATAETAGVIEANPVFGVLDRALVSFDTIRLETPFEAAGLTILPFAVPGKIPLYLEAEGIADDSEALRAMGEQTIGLRITDGTTTAYYIPGCAEVPDWLVDRLSDADLLLFDGTVWENDEMTRTGTGRKTGARMGHVPMSGAEGSIARLAGLSATKVFIHINNTNPVLQPDGPERAIARDAGWTVAGDGTRFTP